MTAPSIVTTADSEAAELALASRTYYYRRLLTGLRAAGERRHPDDLRNYYKAFSTQSVEIGRQATASTGGIDERVR